MDKEEVIKEFRKIGFKPKKSGGYSFTAEEWNKLLKIIESFWLSKYEAQREELLKKTADKLVKIELDKWNDEVHCTCLAYAIVKVFGEKYEKILKQRK